MKNSGRFLLYYIFIPLGTLLCFTNAVMLFMNSRRTSFDLPTALVLSCQFVMGLLIIIFSLRLVKKAVPLFIGLLLTFWFMLDVIVYAVPDYGVKEFWPCFVLLAGILLIISGRYKYKKLKFGFVIPAVTLIGMGLWYLLFSFRIIKRSFLTIAATLGPVFMLLVALFLVLLFLAQQRHKELVVHDEDTGVFADEDIPINKSDE